MFATTPTDAITLIEAARRPADVFSGSATDPADRRAARRRHRILLGAVHPDRAVSVGIDPDVARDATMTLNALYAAFTATADVSAPTEPHVRGSSGTYALRERLWATDSVAGYRTDNPSVRIEIARTRSANDAIGTVGHAICRLDRHGMSRFAADIVDDAVTANRRWIAYRLPDGLVSLRAVRAASPQGLDGRDWAWMARRILMTLDAAATRHGNLGLDTVLIHPGDHGVVLTGWCGAHGGATSDGAALADLFATMLADRAPRQTTFARRSAALTPRESLREYDLLIGVLYGPRRFRPFTTPVRERN
ncbi:hypothetical protein [Gordonia sp. NPDC003950]|jgi:hypothetical protein